MIIKWVRLLAHQSPGITAIRTSDPQLRSGRRDAIHVEYAQFVCRHINEQNAANAKSAIAGEEKARCHSNLAKGMENQKGKIALLVGCKQPT
jgi:hypothetical protein